jgi:signal transduction histidine kinase
MSYGVNSLAGSEQIIKEGSNSISVTPRLFWFQMENQNWLATRFDEENLRYWFACRTEEQVGSVAAAATAKMRQIPNCFEIHADVAGVIFARSQGTNWAARMARNETGHPSTLPNPALRLATSTQSRDGKELIKMSFYLGNPADFFKRQHIRTLWFAALIAVSAVAALIGLYTSWRAFAQQRSLTDLKTNFVSSVSHELRAPIASVRLMAENLERGKVQEPQKQSEYFRFIGQECRRLSALIENVLDFSRIEQRRKQYEMEPTDLLALVRQTVALMQNNAAEKGVELVLRIPNSQSPATPGHGEQMEALEYQLSLDGHAMQQALVNLIDNALKHSPQGKGVTVGLEMSGAGSQKPGPDNRKVLLWVEDHGPGIPVKEQERIFERFYRRGSELRRDTQGVGIGLSIVKHVVEAHGGEVIVRSTVGEGSRFIIELPVENQESD